MAPQAKLDITVNKPNPYSLDLGMLLASDPNPLPAHDPAVSLEQRLSETAREGAQVIINQLLTTVPLQSTKEGVLLTLPPPTTLLPREKPLPAAKEVSKWKQFAARKGIKPKTRAQRREKGSKFNEETGAYEKTWGYKGKAEEGLVPQDWVVEVDGKGEKIGGQDKKGGKVVKKSRKA